MNFIKQNFSSLLILGLFFVSIGNFSWNIYFSLKDIKNEIQEIHKVIKENNKKVLF